MRSKAARILTVAVLAGAAVAAPVRAGDGHGETTFAPQGVAGGGEVRIEPQMQRALGLKVATVGERPVRAGLVVNGQIEAIPGRSAQINAPVAGRVVRLQVQRGRAVRAGQSLAVLDSPEVRTLALEAQRERAQARSEVDRLSAGVQLARQHYEREKELVALKISARREFQQAEAALRASEADWRAARSRLALSGAALSTRLAQLGQSGVRARADGTVVLFSPIAGVVADQQVTAGEAVEPGKALFRILDATQVWATAQVYEKDLERVRAGRSIEVTTQSYPGKTFRGRIESLDPAVDPQTRTLAVRAVLANPDGLLKPQMYARLLLVSDGAARPVSVVPRSAVVAADGLAVVYRKAGADRFRPVPVELGRSFEDTVEVRAGVRAGDEVVVERVWQLRAQSLKQQGAGVGGDEPGLGEASQPSTARTEAPGPDGAIPAWIWLAAAVALTVVGFLAGLQVAGRRGGQSAGVSTGALPKP
ncbi:efflux RND transporter periplasmic adaptor subunit [Gloeobacter morelensis]|uniref:Efflux RND transporter periplasmic adaptor subunit n=1 Tax=Gloeobacter morelensis MG652769 TaxID=2781736 RepID=A0ABY3PQ44_9CYAN|nr:efflux RND transporter periplasmic adaptor subunit [Gloeobacter morelensis]UFP95740.1 efflux RND transporter periplasmic adaptor subunit [Gloeobacter morelensis MG652769]